MTTQATIYHNPCCSKSRGALSILEENGAETSIIKYLDTPPNASELKKLLDMLGMSARELLRKGESEYKALGLSDNSLSDDELIDAMTKHPKLIERPIIIVGDKAIVGRPPERVQELI